MAERHRTYYAEEDLDDEYEDSEYEEGEYEEEEYDEDEDDMLEFERCPFSGRRVVYENTEE